MTTKKRKPIRADKALGEALVSSIDPSPSVSAPIKVKDAITVSICDKARELASNEAKARVNEAMVREQTFMDSLFPDRTQYVNHGDHTYTICGLRWTYDDGPPRLYVIRDHPDNQYRSTPIFGPWDDSTASTCLTHFGAVLLRRDAHVEFIDRTYPNTLWGRIRLWFNYHFL